MPRLEFLETSSISFKHLFLKDWDAAYEVPPYPPTTGEFAIYRIEDFYDAVNYTVAQVKIFTSRMRNANFFHVLNSIQCLSTAVD